VNFESSKTLGGVGALLLFIGFIPQLGSYTFGALPLVGLILLLVGMKGLADYYKETGIFNNVLYGTVAGIAGVVVFAAVLFTSLVGFLTKIFPTWNGDWTSFTQLNPADISANIVSSNIWTFVAEILIAFVILFVTVLIVALFYRKSLELLRNKTGIGMFGTVGTLLLIGAVLTIILIGLILVWIAILLLAIAFFQLRPQQTQTNVAPAA
jgi:uncharacterized membrane protein